MNLRVRVMIIGSVVGALLGVGAAYLYLKSTPVEVDAGGRERLPAIHPGKAITVALGLLTVVKQITGLGRSA